jgi:acyl-CoA thioesterase YciA
MSTAVGGMVFHIPVHVRDEVSAHADMISTVRASMSFRVEAWRRSRDGDESIKVTEAIFTFVAVDSGSLPRPLLPG